MDPSLKQSVAITGASSFAGFWIAMAFAERGWKVHCLYSQQNTHYTGIRAIRVKYLQGMAIQHFGVDAEHQIPSWIRRYKPGIWIHHHHWMEGFKKTTYDLHRASQIGLAPLEGIISALCDVKCKGIIHSASYFEVEPNSVTPATAAKYIESKKQVREKLIQLAKSYHLPCSTIFIPNPVGPLDNENKLVPLLVKAAQEQKPLHLLEPDSESAFFPVTRLASLYVAAAHQLLEGKGQEFHPQGTKLKVTDWVHRIENELIPQIINAGSHCPQLAQKEIEALTLEELMHSDINWKAVWEHYSSYTSSHKSRLAALEKLPLDTNAQ